MAKALVAACLLGAMAWAGTPGVFQGTIVEAVQKEDEGSVYVQGRNGSLRKVRVSAAEFVYGDEVAADDRQSPVPRELPAGTEVRVTAEGDAHGEWRASRVEIVHLVAKRKR